MKVYCVYTNELVEESETTPEHIIPLSLGGCNVFTIPIHKKVNSEIGSEIDGKLANDILIGLVRKHNDYRGHSKKRVEPTWRNSKLVDKDVPVQVRFTNDKIHVFNLREKRALTSDEVADLTIQSTFRIDRYIRILFTAKVLLSAGYFVYGNVFRDHADHHSLRTFMKMNSAETKEEIADLPLRVVDKFYPIAEEDRGLAGIFEAICKLFGGSCVIFAHTTGRIIGTVGIGGEFIGSINFAADTNQFPNDNSYRLGHVIGVQNGLLVRDSFYDVNTKLLEFLNKKE